jgi:hypothetical protein
MFPDGPDQVLWEKYISSISYVNQCFLICTDQLPEDMVIVLYSYHMFHMDYEGANRVGILLMIFQNGKDIYDGTISKSK